MWTSIDGNRPAGAASLNDLSTTRTLSGFKRIILAYRRLLRVQAILVYFKIAQYQSIVY